MKRLLAAAAVLVTLSHAAAAGELTLFADSDFRGARITLQGDARDLNRMNFNDRVSSLVVRSGTWELCSDSDFRGRCAQFGPGEYHVLPGFNDAVSSARELTRGPERWQDERDGRDAHREDRREAWREERREEMRDERRGEMGGPMRGGPAVELFSGPRFEGQEVAVSGDVRAMSEVGFNDRAVSVVIREGRWEFCEHADFRGQCVVFGPGRYPFLEGMNGRISSMRRVR
jgi:hypothetical protein